MENINEAKSKVTYEVEIYYDYDRYANLYKTTTSSLKAAVKFIQSKAESIRKKVSKKFKSIAINSLYDYTARVSIPEEYYGNTEIKLGSLYKENEDTFEHELIDADEIAKKIEDGINADHEEKVKRGFYDESKKKNTLQRRFEHVLHNNKSKDIIASLITNADAIDKSLARILGVKSDSFVLDPHSRKSGLVIEDIKGSDKNLTVLVDGNADDCIVISGALRKDVKVTRKLPADSSVKRIAGMIATVIYEMDSTDFSAQDAETNPYAQ